MASPKSGGRLVGPAPDERRDERVDAAFLTGILVHVFSVVSGVCRQGLDRRAGQGFVERRSKVLDVRAGAASGHDRQDQMTFRIAENAGFRKRRIGGLLPEFAATGASSHEVVTDVMRLPTGTVQGGQPAALSQPLACYLLKKQLLDYTLDGLGNA